MCRDNISDNTSTSNTSGMEKLIRRPLDELLFCDDANIVDTVSVLNDLFHGDDIFTDDSQDITCSDIYNGSPNTEYSFDIKETASIKSTDNIDDSGEELLDAEKTQKDNNAAQPCCICLERIHQDDYSTNECNHIVCSECMHEYLNRTTNDPRYQNYEYIYCPGLNCESQFVTGEILPKIFTENDEQESWWSQALTRVLVKNSTVCPFEDCRELFDAEEINIGECVFTECQSCHRGFCLSCRKEWHAADESTTSENIRKTTEILENMMLTAEEQNWSRCPSCKNMVEKNGGCNHISCRCGAQFCYRCGSLYSGNICANRCESYDQQTLETVRKPMFYVERFERNRNRNHVRR